MDEIQINLNKTLNTFENALNIAGYVPFISSFSGATRISYGKLEIIVSIAAAGLLAIKALFSINACDRQRELDRAATTLITYSVHGLANIMRGFIEALPFVSLFTCLPYDLLGNRFIYPIENQPLVRTQQP